MLTKHPRAEASKLHSFSCKTRLSPSRKSRWTCIHVLCGSVLDCKSQLITAAEDARFRRCCRDDAFCIIDWAWTFFTGGTSRKRVAMTCDSATSDTNFSPQGCLLINASTSNPQQLQQQPATCQSKTRSKGP